MSNVITPDVDSFDFIYDELGNQPMEFFEALSELIDNAWGSKNSGNVRSFH